jgi:hypothetical protein
MIDGRHHRGRLNGFIGWQASVARAYLSVDTALDDDSTVDHLTISGMPVRSMTLKIGCRIMFLCLLQKLLVSPDIVIHISFSCVTELRLSDNLRVRNIRDLRSLL